MMARKTAAQLHQELMASDPEYAQEYDALESEFSLAEAAIQARKSAQLTQQQLAERMNTTQATIARIEGGQSPSIKTLERWAEATGTKLRVSFVAEGRV